MLHNISHGDQHYFAHMGVSTGHRTCASYLGLGLIFILIEEKLVPTQHEPALLPVLHDAPLLLQPTCLQHGAQPLWARWPSRALALLPHHQAFGTGWNPKTHIVSMEDGKSEVSLCPMLTPVVNSWKLRFTGKIIIDLFVLLAQMGMGWSVSAISSQMSSRYTAY